MDSERCANPVCRRSIEPLSVSEGKNWRRTPRKYCSDGCKRDGWILAKAAEILFRLDRQQWWAILSRVMEENRGPAINDLKNGWGKSNGHARFGGDDSQG